MSIFLIITLQHSKNEILERNRVFGAWKVEKYGRRTKNRFTKLATQTLHFRWGTQTMKIQIQAKQTMHFGCSLFNIILNEY